MVKLLTSINPIIPNLDVVMHRTFGKKGHMSTKHRNILTVYNHLSRTKLSSLYKDDIEIC
jgi:hypothetical protein